MILPSGKDTRRVWASNVSTPELGRQEEPPLRAADQEGLDPARTLLCAPILSLPSLRASGPVFLLEEGVAS